MTPNPTSEVTQEDRNGAASLAQAIGISFPWPGSVGLDESYDDDPMVQAFAAHRLAERNACTHRATQLLNSHPHAPPSPHEIIFAIRHPGEEAC